MRILYIFEDDGELRLTYEGVAESIGADPAETNETLHTLAYLGKLAKCGEFYSRNLAYAEGRSSSKSLPPRRVCVHVFSPRNFRTADESE